MTLITALSQAVAERAELADRREQLISRLQESVAQVHRGETFSPHEVRDRLAKRREDHPERA